MRLSTFFSVARYILNLCLTVKIVDSICEERSSSWQPQEGQVIPPEEALAANFQVLINDPRYGKQVSYHASFVDDEVVLPCHFCDQITTWHGVEWRVRDVLGNEKPVSIDRHDSSSANRVSVLEEGLALRISPLEEGDAGLYACRVLDSQTGQVVVTKIEHLLDIIVEGAGTARDISYVNMEKIFNYTEEKLCESIGGPLVEYGCQYDWTPWSACDSCEQVGLRSRKSRCRLTYMAKVEVMNAQGDKEEIRVPVVLMNCFSTMLLKSPVLPENDRIRLSNFPVYTVYQKCKEDCDQWTLKVEQMRRHTHAFFARMRAKVHKFAVMRLPGLEEYNTTIAPTTTTVLSAITNTAGFTGSPRKIKLLKMTRTTIEGHVLTLICPLKAHEASITWKHDGLSIKPHPDFEPSDVKGPRVFVDADHFLQIKHVKAIDEGVYSCYSFNQRIATIKLVVRPRFHWFNFDTSLGRMSLVYLICFALYLFIVIFKFGPGIIVRFFTRKNRKEDIEGEPLISQSEDNTGQ